MATVFPDPEQLGRRRFPDNKGFRLDLFSRKNIVRASLLDLLPSNYPPESTDTNLSVFYRLLAREFARLRYDINAINEDKVYTTTRVKFLYQVLGERLFLGENIAPENYNDESYRNYLIAIKDAFLTGSKKTNIEDTIEEFTDQTVRIKELYLEARKPNSAYDVSDTHKMLIDIIVDDLISSGKSINQIQKDLDFFVNLIKPAHVLYDTRFIWTEQIDVNKVFDVYYGDTGGGCIPIYDYDLFDEPVVLALSVIVVTDPSIATGQIDSIHHDDFIFFLTDGTRVITEPGVDGTVIYNAQGKRISINELQIGQYVQINSIPIPGDFKFWWVSPYLDLTSFSRFYRSTIRRPIFQEFVKKKMDSKGRFPLQIKTTPTTVCDRWVQDLLNPFYEDMRQDCLSQSISDETTSITLNERMWSPRFTLPWPRDEVFDDYISVDYYTFQLPDSPLTDGSNSLAGSSDISVSIDGTSLPGAITSVDASGGIVNLTDSSSFWDSSGITPALGDVFKFDYNFSDGTSDFTSSANLIFGQISRSLYGDPYRFQLSDIPVTDVSGIPASISDISVVYDGTSISGSLEAIDASTGYVKITDSTSYWISGSPVPGQVFEFDYNYNSDGTITSTGNDFVFGISNWQLSRPIVNESSDLADSSDVRVYVDGTQISASISYLNPLQGHVSLYDTTSFWVNSELGRVPQLGDEIDFVYYQGKNQLYTMLLDDPGRVYDGYNDNRSLPYTLVLDGTSSVDPYTGAITKDAIPEIGYRYRTYLLHHTSVLNSPDTLLLNNYQKPVKRASLINQQDSVSHFNLFFSGEFLNDTNSIQELNDNYLENGLDPILKLKEGTPPFQKTFSYHPDLIYHRKLQDIREHRHPLLYSDLFLKEFRENGDSVPLSSICDSEEYSFKIQMTETIPSIEECDPWILYDSVEAETATISFYGDREGDPNLRVPGKKLREDFILRGTTGTGTMTITQIEETPETVPQTTFYLNKTLERYVDEYGYIDFPALPVMKDSTTIADSSDVQVKINGTVVTDIIKSFNPNTGVIELYHPEAHIIVEHITLTKQNIEDGYVNLTQIPKDPDEVAVSVVHGPNQVNEEDYIVTCRKLIWENFNLENLLTVGDKLVVVYEENVLVDATVEFTYKILSEQTIDIIDEDRSRILDSVYVFGNICPDPIQMTATLSYKEYINYLNDYSEGIKYAYYNKDTHQIEEYVFTGPVFEYYQGSDDEISSPDAFPGALVKLQSPFYSGNPLTRNVDYSFINDGEVRIRKKTIKELLPDRTFRTLNITEMLPV